ncbi:GAF domain-containing protein [Oscillatoria sp. FACHB-1407]|uniref:sensor histidine kinase n=1 Tax=Oscillatoria sp. FACHB-1407 TaxID=2692847 RepID=UPI0016830907|nr:GAF domain-containing protein [Oscillatoria sp. FACHB-1407]MBD2463337.1 GAF domain-containing protein [Oscillatoria sp. FACHB-1407]
MADLIFFQKVQDTTAKVDDLSLPKNLSRWRSHNGEAEKTVVDETFNANLQATQQLLGELLQSTSNLSPDQHHLLTRALDHLAYASTEINTVLTELKLNQQELTERIEQEQAVGAIAQRVHQSLNSQEIFQITASGVQQLLNSDRAIVYKLDLTKGLIAIADSSTPAHQPTPETLAYQTWLKGLLHQSTADPYAVADIRQETLPVDIAETLHRGQVKGLLVIPIAREEQILGAIAIHHCSEPRQWQSLEIQLLKQLADQVAIALQQSELYQQVQHLNADLEKQVQQRTVEVQKALDFESMLKRITDKVRDSLDESQILQTAVQELTFVLGLGGCNSALYDLSQGTSTICYEYTDSVPAYQGRVAQMDHFPEIYSQLQQGHYLQFCSLVPNPVRGQVAMLACPIFVDSNVSQGIEQAVLGDLWLIHDKEHVFTEFEIRMVQQVANQCAIAIRQARLFQAAQGQVQELEKLNRLKDEFLSTVSHELRTPITNVKMAIHMLRIATDEERRQRCLNILEAETAREAELIDELLDLQRLEAATQPITLEQTQIQNWLPALIEPFRSRTASRQQTLKVDCPPDLPAFVTDVIILRRILAELLNNACKYTSQESTITFRVASEPHPTRGNTTVITIGNQADIPPTELPHIFEKFYRVIQVDRYKQGGTGLGLALVQKRVEQLNGSVEVESLNGWTTFTVRLPALQLS